jgi:hypothetical protein
MCVHLPSRHQKSFHGKSDASLRKKLGYREPTWVAPVASADNHYRLRSDAMDRFGPAVGNAGFDSNMLPLAVGKPQLAEDNLLELELVPGTLRVDSLRNCEKWSCNNLDG